MTRALLLFGRALLLRCPNCGGGPVFKGYFTLRETCPRCGLRLEREEGHYLGAMLLNLLVAEGLFIVGFVILLVRTWPTPPWTLLTYGSAAAVVLLPILFYPFSRTCWLALDVLLNPPTAQEQQPRAGTMTERDLQPSPPPAETGARTKE
jgi:uncharacterized protein (DUF983 family)